MFSPPPSTGRCARAPIPTPILGLAKKPGGGQALEGFSQGVWHPLPLLTAPLAPSTSHKVHTAWSGLE